MIDVRRVEVGRAAAAAAGREGSAHGAWWEEAGWSGAPAASERAAACLCGVCASEPGCAIGEEHWDGVAN